jgi:hypothetical protein
VNSTLQGVTWVELKTGAMAGEFVESPKSSPLQQYKPRIVSEIIAEPLKLVDNSTKINPRFTLHHSSGSYKGTNKVEIKEISRSASTDAESSTRVESGTQQTEHRTSAEFKFNLFRNSLTKTGSKSFLNVPVSDAGRKSSVKIPSHSDKSKDLHPNENANISNPTGNVPASQSVKNPPLSLVSPQADPIREISLKVPATPNDKLTPHAVITSPVTNGNKLTPHAVITSPVTNGNKLTPHAVITSPVTSEKKLTPHAVITSPVTSEKKLMPHAVITSPVTSEKKLTPHAVITSPIPSEKKPTPHAAITSSVTSENKPTPQPAKDRASKSISNVPTQTTESVIPTSTLLDNSTPSPTLAARQTSIQITSPATIQAAKQVEDTKTSITTTTQGAKKSTVATTSNTPINKKNLQLDSEYIASTKNIIPVTPADGSVKNMANAGTPGSKSKWSWF